MKNLELFDNISNHQVVMEISRNRVMFGANPIRQYPGSAHAEVDDVLLRGPHGIDTPEHLDASDIVNAHQEISCFDYFDTMMRFPHTMQLVEKIYNQVEGFRLGRVMITRLKPGGVIDPHVDEGPVPEYYTRYHYVIVGSPGNLFTVDGDTTIMLTGELWRVDVTKEHSVNNYAVTPRIHLIMDIA